MSKPNRLASMTANNGNAAAFVVTELVKHSCYFEVTPLPFDRWEIAVKDETALTRYLGQLVDLAHQKWPNVEREPDAEEFDTEGEPDKAGEP